MVGIVIFIPVFVASLGIDFAGLGIAPLTYPISLAPWIVLGWIALGGAYLTYLRTRRPEAIAAIGRVFEGTDEPEAAASERHAPAADTPLVAAHGASV